MGGCHHEKVFPVESGNLILPSEWGIISDAYTPCISSIQPFSAHGHLNIARKKKSAYQHSACSQCGHCTIVVGFSDFLQFSDQKELFSPT